jgi:SAM-dependent methyltransferase
MAMADRQSEPTADRRFYSSHYQQITTDIYADIGREMHDDYFGQTSWISAGEQDRLIEWLGLCPDSHVLDVACGSGGPSLRMARQTGCRLTGVEIQEQGVANGNEAARRDGLAPRVRFQRHDANQSLPFSDATFDAVLCIDAINHLGDRPKVMSEWARVLKPGGRVAFTDPITVTGPLTKEEIAIRSGMGFYLFVPPDYNPKVIGDAGLDLLVHEDSTPHVWQLVDRWRAARARREEVLREIEGDALFEALQTNLEVSTVIGREQRLSRFILVAAKPSGASAGDGGRGS